MWGKRTISDRYGRLPLPARPFAGCPVIPSPPVVVRSSGHQLWRVGLLGGLRELLGDGPPVGVAQKPITDKKLITCGHRITNSQHNIHPPRICLLLLPATIHGCTPLDSPLPLSMRSLGPAPHHY